VETYVPADIIDRYEKNGFKRGHLPYKRVRLFWLVLTMCLFVLRRLQSLNIAYPIARYYDG